MTIYDRLTSDSSVRGVVTNVSPAELRRDLFSGITGLNEKLYCLADAFPETAKDVLCPLLKRVIPLADDLQLVLEQDGLLDEFELELWSSLHFRLLFHADRIRVAAVDVLSSLPETSNESKPLPPVAELFRPFLHDDDPYDTTDLDPVDAAVLRAFKEKGVSASNRLSLSKAARRNIGFWCWSALDGKKDAAIREEWLKIEGKPPITHSSKTAAAAVVKNCRSRGEKRLTVLQQKIS